MSPSATSLATSFGWRSKSENGRSVARIPPTYQIYFRCSLGLPLDAPASGDARHDDGQRHLLVAWLETCGDDLSPTTLREYRRMIETRIIPGLGDVPLRKLQPAQVDRLYTALRTKAGLSPGTIRKVHAILHRAFGQAVRWGWVQHNVIDRTSPPRLVKAEHTPPDPQQVAELIDQAWSDDPAFGLFLHLAAVTGARRCRPSPCTSTAASSRRLVATATADEPDFGMFVRLAAVTGARRGELCALRWEDVDRAARSLLLRRALIDVGGVVTDKQPPASTARPTRATASRRPCSERISFIDGGPARIAGSGALAEVSHQSAVHVVRRPGHVVAVTRGQEHR